MNRFEKVKDRVLLPVGLSAVVLGAVGDALLGSTVLFAVGLVVTVAVIVAWLVGLYVSAGQAVSRVSRYQPYRELEAPPSVVNAQVRALEGGHVRR